ncbi:hypothetical protein AB7M45_007781 [Bradyrhizobium elkanii]|uniref:hypothetical protein n=1 Tax=Bradyrhizobium elkanii TaxID=29448 RepID=UPI00091D95DB|nr:hypothetical protein [Bradyrhizobium elkanii]MCW2195010.1 hypothetical protein [Bradyrhizobium elkanii]NWL67294.1 hypothetical protein [Bradyrhizobium elkanii]OIM94660.1 hypothetical protein BLN97_09315 [Bradyrhizobium elkanii]
MTRLTPKLLSFDEYKALGDKAVADGFWRNDRRIFLPGMGWFNDWYLDRDLGKDFLSPHYYRDWFGKRAPIELVCPNGEIWCIDRMSSNGNGWQVTGEWPNITCSPSIVAGNYHGFLRGGEFTADLDGRQYPVPNIGPDYGRPR